MNRDHDPDAAHRQWKDDFIAGAGWGGASNTMGGMAGAKHTQTHGGNGICSDPMPPTQSGDGVLAPLGESLGEGTFWIVEHVWPLRMAVKLGEFLEDLGWKIRLPLAAFGAILCTSANAGEPVPSPLVASLLEATFSPAGNFSALLAIAIGFLIGWNTLSFLGYLLKATVYLIGAAILLAAVYTPFAFWLGWPPFAP